MRDITKRNETRAEKYIFFTVIFLMVLSFLWAFANIFIAPLEYDEGVTIIKNDYILMATQAIAAIGVLCLPTILEKKHHYDIPSKIHIFVILFLFTAVFLGEFRRFHFLVPYFDKMLHVISGAFLASLGFSVIQTLNDYDIIHMNPFFVALFSFCFAMTVGAFWELYEYAWDVHLNLNMLKYMDEYGVELVGLAAIRDTMTDIFVDAIGAGTMSFLGFIAVKYDKLWIHDFIIYKTKI